MQKQTKLGNIFQQADATDRTVYNALRSVRRGLGMETGFVSEFIGDERVLRVVDCDRPTAPIRQGQRIPLSEGYCKKVVDGALPELIPDTSRLPAAMAIPETTSMPIGSHVSVPIKMSDGSVYGTFCAFSSKPDASLGERDLCLMRTVADVVGAHIAEGGSLGDQADRTAQIRTAIANGDPRMVYQPVVRLADFSIAGAEALSRFATPPIRPDLWFEEAAEVGLQADLEMAAIRNALAGFADRWSFDPAIHLAVNVSARTVLDGKVADVLLQSRAERIILEITEHDEVTDYDTLGHALSPLRARGVKIAVDDTGSGYSSLHHVLQLSPDIIKLDIKLIRNIDTDKARRAMAAALLEFAIRTDCEVVAEGIETPQELAVLKSVGIHMGQGYLLGRPGPIEALPRKPLAIGYR